MTVVGLDDTDSRTRGMCTTYVGHRVAERLRTRGTVDRLLLVRCNPAVEHKTRGNAAVGIHTDVAPAVAHDLARDVIEELAVREDPATDPGLVVAPAEPGDISDRLARFANAAVRDHLAIDTAERLIDRLELCSATWGEGRGRIGALAAVGAWNGWTGAGAGPDWTHECIAYRPRDRWGTPREVDVASVRAAAAAQYPRVWDTIDRASGDVVCVPHTPGPVLFGIRGDDAESVMAAAGAIDAEPIDAMERFLTNQGTDAHLRPGRIGTVRDGRAYRVTGTVIESPETREGGHVFLTIGEGPLGATNESGHGSLGTVAHDPSPANAPTRERGRDFAGSVGAVRERNDREPALPCVAFEPTKRFRDRVRALRRGDRITVCGEVTDGTLKLEKFAVRTLVRTVARTPVCPDCGRRMESAGRGQGYRCRSCTTARAEPAIERLDRGLRPGWYEVPPVARRHVAKPLVRGGFDAPIHPSR